jgi:hypothetical protein
MFKLCAKQLVQWIPIHHDNPLDTSSPVNLVPTTSSELKYRRRCTIPKYCHLTNSMERNNLKGVYSVMYDNTPKTRLHNAQTRSYLFAKFNNNFSIAMISGILILLHNVPHRNQPEHIITYLVILTSFQNKLTRQLQGSI